MKGIVASAFFLLILLIGKGQAQQPTLILPNMSAQVGDTVLIPVKAVYFDTLASIQFSVNWDPSIVEYLGTNNYYFFPEAMNGFNTSASAEGKLGFLWTANPGMSQSVADSTSLFSIRFKVVGEATTSIVFSESPIPIELSYLGGNVTEAEDMVLVTGTFVSTTPTPVYLAEKSGFAFYQNEPNPFRDVTRIPFTLPEAAHVRLSIFDMMGRKIASFESSFQAGGAFFPLKNSDFGSPGNYIYTLETGQVSLSGKLLFLK